jgi:hypothetical protein
VLLYRKKTATMRIMAITTPVTAGLSSFFNLTHPLPEVSLQVFTVAAE